MIRHADEFPTAVPFMPAWLSLKTMRETVDGCRGCDLYNHATQAVFGVGRQGALIMLRRLGCNRSHVALCHARPLRAINSSALFGPQLPGL